MSMIRISHKEHDAMQGSIILYLYILCIIIIRTRSVTFITNHEAAFITVCAPENDCPMVVGVAPPTSLTDSAGIHPVTSTLSAGAANHLGVLKHHIISLQPSRQSGVSNTWKGLSICLSCPVSLSCSIVSASYKQTY